MSFSAVSAPPGFSHELPLPLSQPQWLTRHLPGWELITADTTASVKERRKAILEKKLVFLAWRLSLWEKGTVMNYSRAILGRRGGWEETGLITVGKLRPGMHTASQARAWGLDPALLSVLRPEGLGGGVLGWGCWKRRWDLAQKVGCRRAPSRCLRWVEWWPPKGMSMS